MGVKELFYESYMHNRCGIRKRFTLEKIKSEIKYFFNHLFSKEIELIEGAWSGINIKATSSFDDEIARKGAIIDNMGNPHTTAYGYKNYLKDNGLVIRDWKEGTNSGSRQFKGCETSDIPNF